MENLTIKTYVLLIKKGKMALEEVPVEFQDKVKQALGVA
jgi:hypothetical protein